MSVIGFIPKDQINDIKISTKKISRNLIKPSETINQTDVVIDHTSEPIKNLNDIFRISQYLIKAKRYRDNMLFIVGINFGLRVSDLRVLQFSDLINDNLTFKDRFAVFEKKTRHTRKQKKNRYITINDAVVDSIMLYLENTEDVSLSDYLFKSLSNRTSGENQPLSSKSVDRILKGIKKDLDLNIKVSTHTLRKTFCYHQMLMSNNDTRKLLLLQKMLNHSSPAQTLDYIGITGEEIEEAYKNLNLGSNKYNYLINGSILEANVSTL